MADPLAIVATVLGTVATAITIWRSVSPASPPPAPRETLVPPAPALPPAARNPEIVSLEQRLHALEVEVVGELAEIRTLITERTSRRKAADRGSDG